MVPRDTKEFFMWKLLHVGREGAAYMMGARNNSCCAVKMCDDPEFELGFWKKAYGPEIDVWTTTLNGRPALVMPFFFILTPQEYKSDEGKRLIEQHKAELAARDVVHDDIRYGNVVWADVDKKDAVMFIDWGKLSQPGADDTNDEHECS